MGKWANDSPPPTLAPKDYTKAGTIESEGQGITVRTSLTPGCTVLQR